MKIIIIYGLNFFGPILFDANNSAHSILNLLITVDTTETFKKFKKY